jgi:hypothetical protein
VTPALAYDWLAGERIRTGWLGENTGSAIEAYDNQTFVANGTPPAPKTIMGDGPYTVGKDIAAVPVR